MSRDTWILLALAAGAYWFLFRKQTTLANTYVQAPPAYNPNGGSQQVAPQDVFASILDIIKSTASTIDNLTDGGTQAQVGVQRF